MRIAHIITGLGLGGAETMLYKLLERPASGTDAHVISLSGRGHYGPLVERLGVPLDVLDMRWRVPDPVALFRLRRRIRELQPDVVQTWMYHADLLGGLAARAAGVGALAWGVMQGNLSASVNRITTLATIRACGALSASVPRRIVTVSQGAIDAHVARGYQREKFTVLPLGFDLGRFRPDEASYAALRIEIGLDPGARIIGHVGRFDAQKNHAGLLRAFARVTERMPDLHLVMVGSGVDGSNMLLNRLVTDLGLSGRVSMLGIRKEIADVMAGFDVFASPSIGEGFPNVIGEAMATGVPCVVTDVGDCAAVLGGAGEVVSAGDDQAMAAALLKLLGMGRENLIELGAHARQRVAQEYEIGAVVRRYHEFHAELVQ